MYVGLEREDAKQKRCAPVVIEDDVLIGVNSIILKGVTIGARSIIGAGSVVTKSVPSDCVACGNPCACSKNTEYGLIILYGENTCIYRRFR